MARARPPRSEAAAPQSPDAATAATVVAFWCEAGPARWFSKDEGFDRQFRERFHDLHFAAARRACDGWLASAEGALALLLLLDQYPRNAFRGTGHMYATDALARMYATDALDARLDQQVAPELRLFFYLPLSHSELLADQQRALALNRALGEPYASHAQGHLDIIARFGRFPHRNPMLGRQTSAEEAAFLQAGGFAG